MYKIDIPCCYIHSYLSGTDLAQNTTVSKVIRTGGDSMPPSGVQGQSPSGGQGAKPPEAPKFSSS